MSENIKSIYSEEYFRNLSQEYSEEVQTLDLLKDYFDNLDPKIRSSAVALKPAKSAEFGKIDQPMLNHIRNGVWAVIELNSILNNFGGNYSLSDKELKEVISLFSIHDVHKLYKGRFKEEFNLSEEEVMSYVELFSADKFSPELTKEDFHSTAIATHKNTGYHSEVSRKFILYQPYIALTDALAGMNSPEINNYHQNLLKKVNPNLKFYYHTFQESLGIISNLIHTGVSEWGKEKGLTPFLIFEKGILYVGNNDLDISFNGADVIEEIYEHFKNALNSSHPAISNPTELSKSITVQGSKNLYSIENVSFFYSGFKSVIKAFLSAAVIREEENKSIIIIDLNSGVLKISNNEPDMQSPPIESINISSEFIEKIRVNDTDTNSGDVKIECRTEERKKGKYTLIPTAVYVNNVPVTGVVEISGTGLKTSQAGYRLHILDDFGYDIGWNAEIISYSRAISGLRKIVINELCENKALNTTDSLAETCRFFKTNLELTRSIAEYVEEHHDFDHHRVGGFWNYSYIIARDLLDRDINGVIFKNLTESEKIQYLNSLAEEFINSIPKENIEDFESVVSYPYKEKLTVWISENLNFNGSMAFGSLENKSDKYKEYCKGDSICRLTSDCPYDNEKLSPSKDTLMMGFSFSNRVRIGGTEPKLYVSVPMEIELGLRKLGHSMKKGDNPIYLRLIPDYFYTPVISELFTLYLSKFDGYAQTNILGIARDVVSTRHPQYDILIEDLISDKGRRNIFRYAGRDFKCLYSAYDLVFTKSKENDTEYWLFATYLANVLSVVTGCRVIVSENPIAMISGDEFKAMVHLEAPHANIRRIFGDDIYLSSIEEILQMTSLFILLGYEQKIDDKFFAKHVQRLKNRPFPGSSLLKEIYRSYQMDSKKGGIGAYVNRARSEVNENTTEELNYKKNPGLIDLSIRLDVSRGDKMIVESIHELAKCGLYVAIPKGYEPHRIEKLFRESAKAVIIKGQLNTSREDYIDSVSGRLLKMMRRAGPDQFSLKPGQFNSDRTFKFAEKYVDFVFYKLCNGNPGKLKRSLNDLSDGFYSATLQNRNEAYERERRLIEEKKAKKENKAKNNQGM